MCHPLLPNSQELRLFSRCRALRFQFQRIDMINRQHSGGHKPRQPHGRANPYQQGQHEQIQVVAASLLQFVLLSIHDDGRDLLVHENEDCSQQSGRQGNENAVKRIAVERRDDPSSCRKGGFEFVGHFQFWRQYGDLVVQKGHGQDCYYDREVADELTYAGGEEQGVLEVLEYDGEDECAEEENYRH